MSIRKNLITTIEEALYNVIDGIESDIGECVDLLDNITVDSIDDIRECKAKLEKLKMELY